MEMGDYQKGVMMDKKFWDKHYIHEDERAGYIILDSIDLESVLKKFKNKDLWDVREHLETEYKLENGHSLFNAISEYDFYYYIKQRYDNAKIRIEETTVYKIY